MNKLKYTTALQSGRSMVEMLGTLAIIGVLSIGGIMGYSYAMDKYRANEVMNDVNLRAIDLIAQASRGGDLSLDEWPSKTVSDYGIGLEVDAATNTTEGGIYVDKVPQRVCEIIADGLVPSNVDLTVNGADYSGSCTEENKMVFYYVALDEALGNGNEACNGPIVDGVCQPCEEGLKWSKKANACICASNTEFLYSGACYSCPVGTTTADNGTECNCPSDYPYWQMSGSGACKTDDWASYGPHTTLCPEGLVPMQACIFGGCLPVEYCTGKGGTYDSITGVCRLPSGWCSGGSND